MPKSKGFTLIELLIVIILVGILAGSTSAVLNSNAQREKAENAKRLSYLTLVSDAIQSYYYAEGAFPSDLNQLVTFEYLRSVPEGLSFSKSNSSFTLEIPKYDNDAGFYRFDSSSSLVLDCLNSSSCSSLSVGTLASGNPTEPDPQPDPEPATLASISLSSIESVFCVGSPITVVVTGNYSDGTSRDLTSVASFTFDDGYLSSNATSGSFTAIQATCQFTQCQDTEVTASVTGTASVFLTIQILNEVYNFSGYCPSGAGSVPL